MYEFPLYHTVNVAVTGHRSLPKVNISRVEMTIAAVLELIKSATEEIRQAESNAGFLQHFDQGGNMKMQVISALAEGADRLVAQEAKKQGYGLLVPLPFAQEEYEKTFGPDEQELENFRTLLKQADKVLEIAASNSNSSQAYADASRVMLAHSELLLAVWNGKKTKYVAGTYATMQAAYETGIPVIYIPTHTPEQEQDSAFQGIDSGCIAVITDADTKQYNILSTDGEDRKHFFRYIKEYLESVLLPKAPGYTCSAQELQQSYSFLVEDRYPSPLDNTSVSSTQNGKLETAETSVWERFKKPFSDKSRRYASEYKRCLILRNLLPLLALVFLVFAINADAILGYNPSNAINNKIKWGCYALQVASWVWLWLLVRSERRRRTFQHQRSYRYIAEYCRVSSYLWSIGYVHYHRLARFTNSTQLVIRWFCHLLTRNSGFPTLKHDSRICYVDYSIIQSWLLQIKNFLSSQMKYHKNRHAKNSSCSRRFDLCAQWLYGIGIIFVAARGISHWMVDLHWMDNWINLIIVAVAFTIPSVGAFFSSYNNSSGVGVESSTSNDMYARLQELSHECDILCERLACENASSSASAVSHYRNTQLIDSKVCYSHLLDLCKRIDRTMTSEVAEWSEASYSNVEKFL